MLCECREELKLWEGFVWMGASDPTPAEGILFEVQPIRPCRSQHRWLITHLELHRHCARASVRYKRKRKKGREIVIKHVITVDKKRKWHFRLRFSHSHSFYSNWTFKPGTFQTRSPSHSQNCESRHSFDFLPGNFFDWTLGSRLVLHLRFKSAMFIAKLGANNKVQEVTADSDSSD